MSIWKTQKLLIVDQKKDTIHLMGQVLNESVADVHLMIEHFRDLICEMGEDPFCLDSHESDHLTVTYFEMKHLKSCERALNWLKSDVNCEMG